MSDKNSTTVIRALRIIKAMAGYEFDGLLLTQIAKATDNDMATCLRMLRTLESEGIVQRDAHNDKVWRLGPAWVQIAIAFQHHLAAKQAQLQNFEHNYTRKP